MKNTIAINNALRYYNTNELVSASNSYKENLSKDLSVTAYNKMLGRICSKHFISGWLLSGKWFTMETVHV